MVDRREGEADGGLAIDERIGHVQQLRWSWDIGGVELDAVGEGSGAGGEGCQ